MDFSKIIIIFYERCLNFFCYNKKVSGYSNNSKGMTLVEVVAAVVIVSITYIIFVTSLGQFSRGVTLTKTRTLANTIALEKIEVLKNKNYYKLMPTQTSDLAYSYATSGFSYDLTYYPPEELYVGDKKYKRYTTVYKVSEDGTGNLVEEPDPSLIGETDIKKIKVRVEWEESGTIKFFELSNLRENPNRIPLDAKISGFITSTGSVSGDWVLNPPHNTSASSPPWDRVKLPSARVIVVEDSTYEAYTDENGAYEIKLPTGSWSLYVTKQGFWSYMTPKYSVGKNQTQKLNVQLTQKLTGIVTGYAMYNQRLLISQIVASTVSPTGFEQEYIELYNPTTWAWTISDNTIDLKIHNKNPDSFYNDITISSFVKDAIDSHGGYYLIANTSTIVVNGTTILADAYYSGDFINASKAGAIIIADDFGSAICSVGWRNVGEGQVPNAGWYEISPSQTSQGITPGYSLIRGAFMRGSGGVISYDNGNAYDERNNFYDFYIAQGAYSLITSTTLPRNTLTKISPKWGTYAQNAFVTADDGISTNYTITSWTGYFQLSMATGTWNMYFVKDNLFIKISSVTVRAGQTTGVPNNETIPSWQPWPATSPPVVIISSATEYGFIVGNVTRMDTGSGISNIKVESSGYYAMTDNNGRYVILVPSVIEGTSYYVTANPYPDPANNPMFVSESKEAVSFLGKTTILNFVLTGGGRIRGWATTNKVDGLPNVVFTAQKGSSLKTAMTDKDGYFEFINLSTGVWSIAPILETGEGSYPPSISSNIVSGQTIFGSTFVISGAMGTFYGKIYKNGEVISSGVLVLASTKTIDVNNLPVINNSLRNSSDRYYSVVSHGDGTYELPVNAGQYKIYLWYTEASRTQITVVNKTYPAGSGTYSISAGQRYNLDFTIP